MKSTKKSLMTSVVALLLCFSMLLGTTYAWFTDRVASEGNIVQTGDLNAEMYWSDTLLAADSGAWQSADGTPIFTYDNWEPGYTEVKYIKVKNAGDLAFQWRLNIEAEGSVPELADVIDVYYINPVTETVTTLSGKTTVGVLSSVINTQKYTSGVLLPAGETGTEYAFGETILAIALHMHEDAGNEYQDKSIGEGFTVRLIATQFNYENDSFDNSYDEAPEWPDNVTVGGNSASADVETRNGLVSAPVSLLSADGVIGAEVPAGVKLNPGVNKLTLSVTDVENSQANVTLGETEDTLSVDVHIDGVAEDNDVVMAITIKELLPVGLNMGNYRLYHVEDGQTVEMTLLADGAVAEHNNYQYDPATGDAVLYLKSFSEIALVADTENVWEGKFDYSWYDASKTELAIANADQLAAFGAIVGGMAKLDSEGKIYTSEEVDGATVVRDSFSGKTVKLIADIFIGDTNEYCDNADASENGIVFYPIGYWNSEEKYERYENIEDRTSVSSGFYNFCGTFDGNGHTISDWYQNTWEMKGDHNWYDPIKEQYYRDGMGLFGKVYGGTVKNLTVKNFSSDGEITTTGVIAAYADGATFENITIFGCNPRVYNIGNGGIVGCVGWYAKEAELKTTFKNITVDNSNKISALWGSYDVACGGIVGQYYPTSGQSSAEYPVNGGIHMENCHVAAQMDVYNDVCANYQYYAYRYTGMLIGSVRENVTENGHSYPKMDGITAKDCTVHFGTWNDYYYCEIIDNTTASYTHDYQMSRLEQVKSVNGTTITPLEGEAFTVPASGRYNYVVVTGNHATENATCYHFKDGKVWNHEDGGYHNGENGEKFIDENGDGIADLKEDKQHIYLEFNNLVTGYGWGVTTKGVGDLAGVTILDREVADSVKKFEGKVTELTTNREYTIGEIFTYLENCGVKVIDGAVNVTIANLDENGNVIATFTRGGNWNEGTISFENIGNITITIQDYYFCEATTITVNVTERQLEEKFDIVMNNGDFLHRVGNIGTVAWDKLFKAKDGVTVGTVSVTVEAVNGTSASGTYSNNAIQFSGTGVVKVTITDNDYCIPTELYLEVVDATNLTSATGTTTGGNFVLLCDVNTSTYVNYWNCTVYGNGFTYSLKGAPTSYNSKQGHGIIITKNATLDNLVIVGDVYNSYGAYTNQDYYNTAVDAVGDTTIQNCYIANCAAPVKARSNVTIKNTTLYGGTVANLLIMSGTATLENVTTANYDDGRTMVGMGIVIHSDATETAKLVLNGTLTQYNFISESKVPTDSYAKNLHGAMFDTDCSQYQFGTSPNRYVNTGIVSLTSIFNGQDITDNANTGYVGKSLRVSSYDGYVYTQPNTSGSVNNNCPEYKPTTQGAVPPSYSFDYTNKNYVAKVDGSNDYCYEENGKVNISMDQGDTFNWDTSILTIGKGITNYTVSMSGTDYTGKSIAFNTAGEYTVTYTYTDDVNYKLDENGNITTYSATYTKTVNIVVAVVEAATKHAEFTFGSSNTASTTVTVGNNTYVMPNVSGTSSTIGSTTVSGQTIYYPIVEIIMSDGKTSHTSGWYAYFPVFSGAVTITDYQDKGTSDKTNIYNGTTTTMPSGLSVVGDPTQLFKYQSASAAGSTPVVKSNKLVYSSASISAKRDEYNTVIQYSYTDYAGATYYYYIGYHAPAQSYSSCVTSDTLITLADGTQKRIDELKLTDKILAWDFFTGKYVEQDIAFIVNHGDALYRIANLEFSDGSELRIIADHGVFDYDLNKFVYLSVDNMSEYIGHRFVQYAADGSYDIVTLTNAYETEEYTSAWSITSTYTSNAFASGFLTVGPPDDFYNWIEMDGKLHYDVEQFQKDVETYGLYTYEDFADYLTYDQFVTWNGAYLKIAVEKGYFTFDYILELIEIYGAWMV